MLKRRSVWVCLAVVAATGCGDELLCPEPPVIVIQSPSGQVATDGDSAAPGVQIDVRARTSLAAGTTLALAITDATPAEIATATADVDAAGDVVFTGITVPNGVLTLRVTHADMCGTTSDETTIDVVAGLGCQVALAVTPAPNDFYDPLPVLAAADDPQPATADFDLGITVTTAPGWDVEVFRTAGGSETSVATTMADPAGAAGFTLALPQGEIGLRAECRGPGGAAVSSLSTRFVVDTIAPTCAMASPVPGSTITPSYDLDGDLGNGVQLLLEAVIGGGDVEGESTTFTISVAGGAPVQVAGTLIGGGGTSRANATVDPASTPSTAMLGVATVDHAGNPCSTTSDYPIVYDGCDIEVTAPTGPVAVDADGNPANGAQIDVALLVDTACVGRPVDSDCGLDPPSATVPPGGALTMRVDMCATTPCEVTESCGFTVTTAAGVETQANVNLVFDAVGPDVDVAVVAPALACGAQVTPSVDQAPGTAGVQVVARVTAANAFGHRIEVTNANGTTTTPAPIDTTITLAPGANDLRGLADDAIGNLGVSPACTITLADLAVSFSPPASDGVVNRNDGAVNGSNLTFPLCGTVSTTGATVTVAIDGGAPQPATVNGTGWCRTITVAESPPSHTIVATASKPPSFGEGALVFAVDLTPPDAISDFSALDLDRQRIRLAWTAPADAGQPVDGYVVKIATSPLTDANFDATGTVLSVGAPAAPGQPETYDHFPARTGTTVWFGAATIDENGNRSVAAIAGPLTPVFDASGAITAGDPVDGNLGLGWSVASGRFDDDDFTDVALGAPGELVAGKNSAGAVYVFLGGASGIDATPDLVIRGDTANGRLGSGVAAIAWTQADRDDLVIGAPGADAGNGVLYVLTGGASFPTGVIAPAAADRSIGAAAVPGWFAGSNLGYALAAGFVDDDAIADLVIAAPLGGAARGGIAIVYGGTASATTIGLSDVDAAAANGAVATLIEDPAATTNRFFGNYLHVVGETEGVGDVTDDIVVGYFDDGSLTDWVYLFRPDGTRPSAAGVTPAFFVAGKDLRIEATSTAAVIELGAQATTIADQNGDGARDLVLSAYRATGGGQTYILDGDALGTGGVATVTTAGVNLTTLSGTGGASRLGAGIAKPSGQTPDVNGDGLEDLIVGGLATGGIGRLYVWFGGEIPTGAANITTADYLISLPTGYQWQPPNTGMRGPAGNVVWLADIEGDGLDDLLWTCPQGNMRDGGFELLFD